MDSIITIIIFVIGAVIGGLTVHLLKRNSNNIEESESLNDVKDLVKDLSDKISLKEGKDEDFTREEIETAYFNKCISENKNGEETELSDEAKVTLERIKKGEVFKF